jgi:hypothetical protein
MTGVTDEGFTIKGFDTIVDESRTRAKAIFGPTVDLTPSSPIEKLIEVTAAEDGEIWKLGESLYYGTFVSTAFGASLDLLGEDVGIPRRNLASEGAVQLTLAAAAPGRVYRIVEGLAVRTAVAPFRTFVTTQSAVLSAAAPVALVPARAVERGPTGDVAAATIVAIDPAYQLVDLADFAPATVAVTNLTPFAGGTSRESDTTYRARLLGLPRTVWTLERVRRAALDVDGVIDVLASDPLGGVDVSQSVFNRFLFDQRTFSSERRLGEPYFFDLIVAHEFAWPFRTQGAVPGVFERVAAAVEDVRPIGIYPNIIQADHIEVGMSARVIVESGFDQQALVAAVKSRMLADVSQLRLGNAVLFSQVMRAFVDQPGVVDVQNLRLRRCPPAFGRISFGAVPFQTVVIEAPVGDNLIMGPTEIALFRLDSDLVDLQVVGR